MSSNHSIAPAQSWSLDDYQFLDFFSNQTSSCPLKSASIQLETVLLIILGCALSLLLTVRIHCVEARFHDRLTLSWFYLLNNSIITLFQSPFLFLDKPTETRCRYEQIFIQYSATLLLTTVLGMSLFRLLNPSPAKKARLTLALISTATLLQTALTVFWLLRARRRRWNYHRQACYHHMQIHICVHDWQPLLLSTTAVPVVFTLTAVNVYRFTKPFAIAQLLESIISLIGLLLTGSMWYMSLFFSRHPQMPHGYVAYVFVLTYLLPRYVSGQWQQSRDLFCLACGSPNWSVLVSRSRK